jgi:hypothetical protein
MPEFEVSNAKKNPEKTTRAMSPATTRSTGPGFDFEDHAAAWLLLKSLHGQELPGVKGSVTRLQMQVEALGWHLDDILFTTDADAADQRHLAISAKSNVQVSAAGLPADFVERAWKQSNPNGAGPMRRDADGLMLATRQRHPAFQATWSDIKLWAEDADPALALARIQSTATHRRVFDSIKNPAKAAGFTVTDADVLVLIKRLAVMPFDFDVAGGEYETLAIAECRRLLASGSLEEGRALWQHLVNRVKSVRLAPSTLDISVLWQELRSTFALKDHPNFAAAWDRLRAITADYRSGIQTALPSGYVLARETSANTLAKAIAADAVCIAYGDSGSGKSALVKRVLDTQFPDAAQVWLGPEQLEIASGEATRLAFGLPAPLSDVLLASAKSQTILVIDSAERLTPATAQRAKELAATLAARASFTGCRVLIVGQTEAWTTGQLQKLAGSASVNNVEISLLDVDDVTEVLRATTGLQWLAMQDDAVSALTNLKALGWVIEGAALFQAQGGMQQLSLTAIADRLWDYWTGAKPSLQRLLMTLGEREASFEHSFALTSFTPAEATELNALPGVCPLRRNNTNRFRFGHDLAADWARFQRLKELSDDVNAWAAFAGNPLWNNALRMLGQFLLRQPSGPRAQWDVAFDEAGKLNDTMPLAADILLDALFLDPNAQAFLDQRADMLFANGAKRLIRLLRRFDHVASVPVVLAALPTGGPDISLVIEAQYRHPIYGRWPAIGTFLTKHRARVVALTSAAVAAVCDRWLTTTPLDLGDGVATPLRKEFAEIALGSARELQLGQETRSTIFMDITEKSTYAAALAGAPDLPDEVAQWALEMVQRRDLRADLVARAKGFRKKEAEEHRKKLESDPEYKKRHTRKQSIGVAFQSRRKLPPWPLGPRKRVDQRFRATVLGAGLHPLMRVRPAAASEILLAAIIDDGPEEEYGSSTRLDDNVGIAYDHEGYPTAYWKSPFYAFLQINPGTALSTLHLLVNFATERWAHEVRNGGRAPTPTVMKFDDGTTRDYFGGYRVFSWSQKNTTRNGQLHSALAALEKWLCNQIDAGVDIAPYLDDLIKNTTSVSVLGVLVNAGKYKPDLFKGPLKCLLCLHRLYLWDDGRVDSAASSFDATTWVRSGEFIFQMARDWVTAPYRQRKLRQIAADIVAQDADVGEAVLAATEQWQAPQDAKAALEFRILKAELDHRNFNRTMDSVSGAEKTEFEYPSDVTRDIQAFQQDVALAQQVLHLPDACRTVFQRVGLINSSSAAMLAQMMATIDGGSEVDLDDDFKSTAKVAAASTLLVKAPDWLADNAEVEQRARAIVDAALAEIGMKSEDVHSRYVRGSATLEFAAYFVADRWVATPSPETDQAVMKIMTSGDGRAVQVLLAFAYGSREKLGPSWWRLLFIALLWAGLSILAPRHGDGDEIETRWRRWLRWLRARRLSATPATIEQINPLGVAERVEKFERRRWRQRYARDGWGRELTPDRRLSGGLDTHFLENAFAWLFAEGYGLADAAEQTALVTAFWTYEAWCRTGSIDDDDKDYQPMGQFGYAVVSAIARLIVSAPSSAAASLSGPVFAIGPRGHYAIGAFLLDWFSLLSDATDGAAFAARWRPMIETMLNDKDWASGRQWHYGQQLERQVLGFGSDSFIARVPDHSKMIDGLRSLYKVWAETRLRSGEDNIAGLCGFLSSEAGRVLRIDGLEWLAAAIRVKPDARAWYREGTSSAFIAFLDVAVSEHSDELIKNASARQALVELVAHGVSRQLPTALALQERVRRLR